MTMSFAIKNKLQLYYIATLISLMMALVAFSYNAWRLEQSEENNRIRTAAFETLVNLAELEQIIYAYHYDDNLVEGSPRKGWVKVGLINDLSQLISNEVVVEAERLNMVWQKNWSQLQESEEKAQQIVAQLEVVRDATKQALKKLR